MGSEMCIRDRVTVGFAAETGDATHTVLQLGREKFARKGCDLLMVNEVGFHTTFGQPTNAGWLLGRGGTEKGTVYKRQETGRSDAHSGPARYSFLIGFPQEKAHN